VRTFVEQVDVVSGVGYARAAAAGPGATRFHDVRRVVSNLGVFDFETPDHTMRLRSFHPGVTGRRDRRRHRLRARCPTVAETRLPTPEELEPSATTPGSLLRTVLDPGSCETGTPRLTALPPGAAHRVLCPVGVRYPIVQTGMGWVAGPRLVAATANAGGLGILASATMTLDELSAAIAEVRARTHAPFGVNLRTDVADVGERIELMIETGARVASFAQAPNPALVTRCKEAGCSSCPPSAPGATPRRWPSGASTPSSPRAARAAATPAPCPPRCCCPRWSTPSATGCSSSGPAASSAAGAWWPPWPTAPPGIAMGTRFLLSAESRVPDAVKALYLGTPVTGTVVTTKVDGAPQRVVRTDLVDHLESQLAAGAAPGPAQRHQFRRETGTSLLALLKEGGP
jgi:hypothetical protein